VVQKASSSPVVPPRPAADEHEDRLDRDTIVAHRYRILRFAGNRGFGQVYQAEDSATDLSVSLMRLDREFSRAEVRDRFFATRGSARIDHAGAVDLTDYGEDLDGRLFLVMPWIDEAEALDELLAREHRLDWARARALVEGIAEALAAAHARGILHGGLEPSRVLVDSHAKPHVLDFGLAPALESTTRAPKSPAPVTDTRVLAGKPAYTPPELVRGEAPNERTDIYALGLLFWELIAGAPPFTGSPVDTLHRQVHDPLPELVRGDAPVEVEALLHLALAKDPEERFASANELLETLRALPGAIAAPQPLPRTPTVPLAPKATTKPAAAKAPVLAKAPVAPATAKATAPKPTAPKSTTGPQPTLATPKTAPKATTGPQPTLATPKPTTGPQPTLAAPKPTTGPQPTLAAPKPATGPQPTLAAPKPATGPQPTLVAPKPTTGPQPTLAAPVLASNDPSPIPQVIQAPPPPLPREPTAPRATVAPAKPRRFGLLERAIVGFLLFDLAVFAAWKLIGGKSEPTEAAEPIAAVEPGPELERPEPADAPEPAAAQPAPALAEPAAEPNPSESAPDPAALDLALAPAGSEPLPKQLTVADFRKTMVDARNELVSHCLDDQRMRRTFKVSVSVAPSGKVIWASVLEAPGKTALGKCISKQTRHVEFPPSEEGGSHVYSLRLR
jgi:serine/threonine protein kinase